MPVFRRCDSNGHFAIEDRRDRKTPGQACIIRAPTVMGRVIPVRSSRWRTARTHRGPRPGRGRCRGSGSRVTSSWTARRSAIFADGAGQGSGLAPVRYSPHGGAGQVSTYVGEQPVWISVIVPVPPPSTHMLMSWLSSLLKKADCVCSTCFRPVKTGVAPANSR